ANPAPRTIAVLTSFRAFTASSSRLPSSLIASPARAVQVLLILCRLLACTRGMPRPSKQSRSTTVLCRYKLRTSGLTPFSGPQTRGATFADPLLRPLHKLFSTDSFLSTERRRAGALLRRQCWSGEMKAARVPRALTRYASVQGG